MGPYIGLAKRAVSAITETEKLTLTVEVTPEIASIDIAFTLAPGSRFAQDIAALRPSNFALLDRLPERSFIKLGGHILAGTPRRPRARAHGPRGVTADSDMGSLLEEPFRTTTTGEVAASISFAPRTGFTVLNLCRVSSTQATDKAIRGVLTGLEIGRTVSSMGMSARIKTSPSTATHDGVLMRSIDITSDISQMPVVQQLPDAERIAMEAMFQRGNFRMQFATFDGLGMFVGGADGLAVAARTIDVVRGKAPLFVASSPTGRLLTASRARKDSVVAIVDMGAMLAAFGLPLPREVIAMISVGRLRHDVHVRVSVPAPFEAEASHAGDAIAP